MKGRCKAEENTPAKKKKKNLIKSLPSMCHLNLFDFMQDQELNCYVFYSVVVVFSDNTKKCGWLPLWHFWRSESNISCTLETSGKTPFLLYVFHGKLALRSQQSRMQRLFGEFLYVLDIRLNLRKVRHEIGKKWWASCVQNQKWLSFFHLD